MRIHHEGISTIIVIGIAACSFVGLIFYFVDVLWLRWLSVFLSLAILSVVVYFFRVPDRPFVSDDHTAFSPANGEVVIVQEVFEKEYFKKNCIQVSIFMSPLNVHLNRYPINGKVVYTKYHPGKYLVAWAPKSSEVNERHSVVIQNEKTAILVRQIAGFLARRIVNYANVGTFVKQNEELGFIKFGSRVDLFFPLGTKIDVVVGQKTVEGITPIASYE